MKALLFWVTIMAVFCVDSYTQDLKHFQVETVGKGWRLSPTFDKEPQSGVNGMAGDHGGLIIKLVKDALKTLPEGIKQKVAKQDVTISFLFNVKGEIFYLNFYVRADDKNFMTDDEWLRLYYTFRKLRLDLSKFCLLDDFEWGSGGMYPISKYLRQETEWDAKSK